MTFGDQIKDLLVQFQAGRNQIPVLVDLKTHIAYYTFYKNGGKDIYLTNLAGRLTKEDYMLQVLTNTHSTIDLFQNQPGAESRDFNLLLKLILESKEYEMERRESGLDGAYREFLIHCSHMFYTMADTFLKNQR